ncbi:MAG: AAA domain-containing protein [Anditalea sp.]
MLKDVFQVYLNRLIDLSAKNRSIFLPKLISSQMIDLKDFHFLNNHPSFFYITELLGRKRNIPLIQLADARDKNVNELSQRLKRLQQNILLAEQETGEKNLFVGWPFVEGKLINEQLIRCPLLFFPVSLVKEENSWYLRKKAGDQPFLNKSFLLAYSHSTGTKLDNEWMETSLEDFSRDPTGFRTALYHFLKEGLTLNFNQELFEDKLDFFPETSRAEEQDHQKTGILKLKPFAVLGQFSQKSSFLINDYELLKKSHHEDLETLFSEWFAVDKDKTYPVMEEKLFNTFPIDASQEEVMKAVRAGESCVVEGPPGTGKSQLICNLVTDFTSRGKKVLVVSQKRAALDVVFKRLSEQGFAAFVALVHDFRADRKDLFRKLSHQINSLETYKELNRGLDAIQLERNFNKMVSIIEMHTDFLEDYKQALFDRKECGVPIKELYVTSSFKEEHLNLTQYYKKYPFNEIDDFLRDFQEYIAYYKKYQDPTSFWLHRVNFSAFGPSVLSRYNDTLNEIREIKQASGEILENLLNQQFEFALVYQLFEKKEKLLELQHLVHHEENFIKLRSLLPYKTSDFDLLWLENKVETIKKLLAEEGIEWTVEDAEVENGFIQTIKVLKLKGSWWRSIALRFDRKNFNEVWDLLKKNGLKDDKEGLKILITKLENRLNLNHQYTLLNSKPWINLPRKPFEFAAFNHYALTLMQAIKSRFIDGELGIFSSYLAHEPISYDNFRNLLEELISISNSVESKVESWKNYLSPVQIKHLLTSPHEEKLAKIQQSITKDFVELVAFDKLKKRLRAVDLEIMPKLIDQYPDKDFAALKMIFLSGLKLSWIEHIEAKYPVLQEVGTPKIKNILEEFSTTVEEKLKISRFIAELRLREKTFNHLEYNRLNNLMTYRDLGHQVTKKKRLWTIKKLAENFEDEIFSLIPCWLASPETVSALFPLKKYFDLVVFDESSQCFVERGLPALLRGKQLVVAGDSQQLRPYDLYQVRMESDEEGIETETDSLLDLSTKYFKGYSLDNHYRSKSLPLIHFSNLHFYDNELSMLPNRESLNKDEPPFELIKVEGIWDRQTNRVEAEAVIEQLKLIGIKSPGFQIGVITFNYYQMDLILDLLGNEESLVKAENIQVKNIENVQGDEFDIVIFSMGYTKNKHGKFTANFGLLARSGGQNRLNVAITRAREKIVLITSMSSMDFHEGQLKNEGVRLLRDYIGFVEKISTGVKISIEPEKPPGFEVSWSLKNKLIGIYGNHEVKNNSFSKVMDLELLENGEYSAGILTDDHRLYASKSVKEAFVYHPQLLRQKNWNVVNIFSRQYWLDREDLLQTKLEIKKRT